MDVSIIIPNYNGEALLKKNLHKVIESLPEHQEIQIIVTDDHSLDNSIAVLEEFKKNLKNKYITLTVIKSEKNTGFAGNVNRGVKKATGEILVLLNTDVIPHTGFLEKLLPHFKNSDVFAVGCLDESIEEGKVVLRGRGKGLWRKGFLVHGPVDVSVGNTTLWASGGSSAFKKTIWDKIGGLNELYNPFYWEDIDLSFRAQKMGYKVLFEKESKVIHEHATGAIKTQIKESRVEKIAYRNQFFFVWLNITDPSLILSHILWLPYHLLNGLKSANTAFLGGFFGALSQLPNVLLYRSKVKKVFIKTDKEIIGAV